jgi:UDP:flavonoid glycosyltransferase YjiC (YdhE family)
MTILVLMADAIGHINGTYNFCRKLQAHGARIVYGVRPQMLASIRAQGFEAVVSNNEFFFKRGGLGLEQGSWLEKLSENFADILTHEKEKFAQAIAQQLDQLITQLNPDVVLLDSFLSYNYFLLNLKPRRVFLLQTMLSTVKRKGVPPLYSRLSIDTSDWLKSLNRQWGRLKNKGQRLITLERGVLKTVLRVASDQKSEILAALDTKRSFRPGIKGLPEIIMAPRAFDLPEFEQAQEQYYAGTQLNHDRIEVELSKNELELLQKMDVRKGEKWVYCSLGTLNLLHNPKCLHFLEQVLEVFRQKPEWNLVLATGMIETRQLSKVPDNVLVYKKVPQLEVLKRCEVIITHGGLNSVLEAIDHKVPLLVYPLNERWDQNGNAARVEYYGVGLRGRMQNAQAGQILRQLDLLLHGEAYLQNLQLLKQKIEAENEMESILEMIFGGNYSKTKLKIAVAMKE